MKPIIVIGSSNTDLVASVERLPGEGETVMGSCMQKYAGGKGANQAVAVVRAGVEVAFAGVVGFDAFGNETVQAFLADGLDLRFLRRTEEAPSGTALISVDQDGKNQIVVVPGANVLVDTDQIDSIDFSKFSMAVFQLEIPHPTVWHGLQKAHAAGCVTLLNPAPAAAVPMELLAQIDYLIPNEHELKIISEAGGSFEQMAAEMLGRGVKNLVVTLGAEGAACFNREGCISVSAPDVPVKDTVGAGDCFVGVFAAALHKGFDLKQSLHFAVSAASISVGTEGAQASYVRWDAILKQAESASLGMSKMEIEDENRFFMIARSVWLHGLEKEKNIHAGFRTVFPILGKERVVLNLAGSTIYRVFLNGEFIQHGPARSPHGFYRVDELDLSSRVQDGDNLLAIEVTGANCHSFAYLNQPSFLQAELSVNGAVVAATGGAGFDALRLPERIQKVERYSFQRPFVEAYRMAPGFGDWRNRIDAEIEAVPCAVHPEKTLLPRGVAFSDFKILPTLGTVCSGTIDYVEKPVDRSGYWWMNDPRYSTLESFSPEEFERDILQIVQACDGSGGADGSWEILDLGVNLTGFIQLKVSCESPIRLMAVFDEVLIDGDIDLDRNKSINLIYYELQPGDYTLESMEPYTFRYLKLIALDGAVAVHEAGLREYANAEASRAEFDSSDADLNLLFEAGRQTFRQNATDLYMDCPGRERAGWLCDSFFTGRVEPLLCGSSKVERNFIENFALPENFGAVPKGMLPMCYPSEHVDGRHIPQWAMWLVLELEEYLQRSGDAALVERMQAKVFGLLDYLKPFENSDGLLEKLSSWNFIEWSKANELVDDVNYPTNMLYARMLESAARLYGREELAQQAAKIHDTVREQSFNGTFFVDNAVRDEAGVLQSSGESTEVCQYYAFFCGTATPDSFSNLWKILCEEFGPDRKPGGAYDAVYPANAFIGYYLRMELLSLAGESDQLLREIKGYFLPMAKTTGTLWEHCDVRASCNHGFASYLCVLLARHADGIVSAEGQR